MKKIIYLLLLFVFFFIGSTHSVHAVNFSASLSPSVQHILIKPGVEGKTNVKIHNTGDPVTLQLKIAKIFPQNDTVQVKDLEGETDQTISFNDSNLKKPFIMTSNESKTINIDLHPSQNLPESDYYYAIIAETVPQPAPEGKTTVHLQGSVTTTILLTVKTNANLEYNPTIVLFETKPMVTIPLLGKKFNIFDMGQPISTLLKVQNNGETTLKADGWLSVQGFKKSETYPLVSKYILVDSQSTMTSSLDTYCEKQENQRKDICMDAHSLVLKGENFGTYTMKATVTAGKQGKGIIAETSFIVLPIKAIGIGLLIALITPLLLLFYINKVQKSR